MLVLPAVIIIPLLLAIVSGSGNPWPMPGHDARGTNRAIANTTQRYYQPEPQRFSQNSTLRISDIFFLSDSIIVANVPQDSKTTMVKFIDSDSMEEKQPQSQLEFPSKFELLGASDDGLRVYGWYNYEDNISPFPNTCTFIGLEYPQHVLWNKTFPCVWATSIYNNFLDEIYFVSKDTFVTTSYTLISIYGNSGTTKSITIPGITTTTTLRRVLSVCPSLNLLIVHAFAQSQYIARAINIVTGASAWNSPPQSVRSVYEYQFSAVISDNNILIVGILDQYFVAFDANNAGQRLYSFARQVLAFALATIETTQISGNTGAGISRGGTVSTHVFFTGYELARDTDDVEFGTIFGIDIWTTEVFSFISVGKLIVLSAFDGHTRTTGLFCILLSDMHNFSYYPLQSGSFSSMIVRSDGYLYGVDSSGIMKLSPTNILPIPPPTPSPPPGPTPPFYEQLWFFIVAGIVGFLICCGLCVLIGKNCGPKPRENMPLNHPPTERCGVCNGNGGRWSDCTSCNGHGYFATKKGTAFCEKCSAKGKEYTPCYRCGK